MEILVWVTSGEAGDRCGHDRRNKSSGRGDGVVVDNREERQAEIPRKGGGVFPAAGGVGSSGGRFLWENLHDLMRTSGYRH